MDAKHSTKVTCYSVMLAQASIHLLDARLCGHDKLPKLL
jgi:hypothetical protein